jgi:hypothetical protein
MYMSHPSQEVKENELRPGLQYHSLPLKGQSGLEDMRGTFVEHFTNSAGYPMVRFRPAFVRMKKEGFKEYPLSNPDGFISRVWLPPMQPMRRFYKMSKFTPAEVAELRRRVRNREKREAQRGLIGSFPEGRKMGSWPVEKLPAVIIGLICNFI